MEKENHTNLLTKISGVLFGIFITSITFAILVQILQELGIWVALILTIALCVAGFKFSKKGKVLRSIAWGMLGTIVLGSLSYFIMLNLLYKGLEGL